MDPCRHFFPLVHMASVRFALCMFTVFSVAFLKSAPRRSAPSMFVFEITVDDIFAFWRFAFLRFPFDTLAFQKSVSDKLAPIMSTDSNVDSTKLLLYKLKPFRVLFLIIGPTNIILLSSNIAPVKSVFSIVMWDITTFFNDTRCIFNPFNLAPSMLALSKIDRSSSMILISCEPIRLTFFNDTARIVNSSKTAPPISESSKTDASNVPLRHRIFVILAPLKLQRGASTPVKDELLIFILV